MEKLKKVLPPMVLMSILVCLWWTIVIQSRRAIFPTPWQVATGALELIGDGTLSDHIGASLMRVAAGFLIATAVAVPVGLWMGRVTVV